MIKVKDLKLIAGINAKIKIISYNTNKTVFKGPITMIPERLFNHDLVSINAQRSLSSNEHF